MHTFPSYVDWTTSSAVVEVKVGAMKQEKSGGVIATIKSGEEKWRFTLADIEKHRKLFFMRHYKVDVSFCRNLQSSPCCLAGPQPPHSVSESLLERGG